MAEDIAPRGKITISHFYDGTDAQYVGPGVGHRLPVDVEASALPDGGATAANQTAMLTALRKIDDLYDALASVALDELRVNVEAITGYMNADNTLFGYNDRYAEALSSTEGAAGTRSLYGSIVPPGEVWVVQAAACWNSVTNPSQMYMDVYDGVNYEQIRRTMSPGAGVSLDFTGPMVMKNPDRMRAVFLTCALDDNVYLHIRGYKMKI